MTRIEQYSLTLYVNGLLQPTKIVSADTTMVDIFSVFGVVGERYTNYSLSVAAINSAGMGEFRESDVLSELGCLKCKKHYNFMTSWWSRDKKMRIFFAIHCTIINSSYILCAHL